MFDNNIYKAKKENGDVGPATRVKGSSKYHVVGDLCTVEREEFKVIFNISTISLRSATEPILFSVSSVSIAAMPSSIGTLVYKSETSAVKNVTSWLLVSTERTAVSRSIVDIAHVDIR